MTLVAFGINHKTAPIEVREKIAFSPTEIPEALQALLRLPNSAEVALLSTCNRTELYLRLEDEDLSHIFNWLEQHKSLTRDELNAYHYLYQGEQAVAHMMKVACGLDSMVLGEPQILGYLASSQKDFAALLSISAFSKE